MYTRILVPVDGSATSDRALDHALKLAREQGARLRVVHVLENPYWYFGSGDAVDVPAVERLWLQAAQEILDAAVAAVRRAGFEPETAILEQEVEPIASAIDSEARRWGADLIVMGTHGRHGVEHLLLGSVAEGVTRAASVPVLLLHALRASA